MRLKPGATIDMSHVSKIIGVPAASPVRRGAAHVDIGVAYARRLNGRNLTNGENENLKIICIGDREMRGAALAKYSRGRMKLYVAEPRLAAHGVRAAAGVIVVAHEISWPCWHQYSSGFLAAFFCRLREANKQRCAHARRWWPKQSRRRPAGRWRPRNRRNGLLQ